LKYNHSDSFHVKDISLTEFKSA